MIHPLSILRSLAGIPLCIIALHVAAATCAAQPSAVDVAGMYAGTLSDATVIFQSPDGRRTVATFDGGMQTYRFIDRPWDSAGGRLGTILITHPEYEPQSLPMKEDTGVLHVQLGLPGSEYTYLGGRKIPYMPKYDEVGVVAVGLDSNRVRRMVEALGEFTVSPGNDGSYFVLRRGKPFLRASDPRIAQLRALFGAENVGPMARIGRGALLTPTILVRFTASVRLDRAMDILRSEGCTDIRRQLGQSFIAKADPALNHGINDLLARLADRPEIESVTDNALTLGSSLDSR